MTKSGWILAAALAVAAPAAAQTGPQDAERQEAARAELIAQAEAASDGGDHARALDLAARALAIRATPSLRLLLATEHDALGHVVDAYELATRCGREAQADPATRNRAQVIEACGALARRLDGRIGRVVVEVPAEPPGVAVRVAGAAISQALWGVPYAVAPGAVAVEATAEGHAPFRQEVQVAAGQTLPVRVTMRALERPAQATPVAPVPPAPPAGPVEPSTPAPSERPAPSLAGPIAGGAVGVAAFALAGVFFALREGAVADRDAQCVAAGCRDAAYDFDATARTYNTLVNVSLGVGAAALVGAGVWFFVARSGGGGPRRAALSGVVSPLPVGGLIGIGGVL